MMPTILAFTEAETAGVAAVASALAETLRLTPQRRAVPTGDGAVDEILRAVDDDAVRVAVLPYSPGHAAHLVTDVIRSCPKPVVVVPIGHHANIPTAISRVLVPLNGTVDSAQTVASTVALFAASGADIVVLHVFDRTTVPRFWDQPVHARKSWDEEFLARFCNEPNARLELRSGSPGDNILDVAATERADLIALGWAQNLSAGRARTVRTTLAQATVPILLVPVTGVRGDDDPDLTDAIAAALGR